VDVRSNSQPILFVDVDGVISLFNFDRHNPPPGSYHSINGVPHYICRESGDRLLRLRDRYELVWATGWEETANEHLPHLLGLPGGLPCLSFDALPQFGTAHWKLRAIEDYAGGRPLAWVDDSLDESCLAWAEARRAPTLLVQTLAHEGFCDVHVEELIAWADQLG
jgi:HAD domain in Swiss Army Knife RNA repair proteins